MTRRQKLHAKLAVAERELLEVLIPALEKVASGDDTLLFITTDNNPWPELRDGSPKGNEIVARAREVLALAQQLGVDASQLVAAMVIRSFEGANELDNPHRLGPIRLAQQLLDEIRRAT